MKTNTFSMQLVKRIAYFIFKLKYVFFHIFSYGQYLPLEKMQFCLRIFLGIFIWNLNILKILKKSFMGSIIDSVKSLD